MQAVLLAAGKSSRFLPFNQNHKSTFMLMGKPIIVHTLERLQKAGITEAILIVSKDSIVPSLIKEHKLTLKISYVEQPNSDGMGNALLLCKKRITGDFLLLHAHHVDVEYFAKDLIDKQKEAVGGGLVILAKSTKAPRRYGIVTLKKDKVLELTEKPVSTNGSIHLRVIGMYLLTLDFLEKLAKTQPEHYHFEKALSNYAKNNSVHAVVTTKEDITLKYGWELLNLKNYLFKDMKKHISKKARIGKNVSITGEVSIEDGVVIMEGASIKGPAYIGRNAYIGSNAIIRGGVILEKDAVIGANMEVKNSILGASSTTHSGFIGDSVIGSNCKIAAYFCSGNLRLDRGIIKVSVLSEKVDSHLKYLGVLMGDSVRVGIRVSTMPGIIIGNNSVIGPTTTVIKNVDENVLYHTRFEQVVEEKKEEEKNAAKKLILFDLDNTLFNAHEFRISLFKQVTKLLSDGKMNKALYKKCQELTNKLVKKSGFFDPEDFIDVLLSDLNMPHKKDELLKVMFDEKITGKHVYREVLENLKLLSEAAHIGILSQGLHTFQSAKLASIKHLFRPEKIHFELDKRSHMEKIFTVYKDYQVYFVDDLLIMLDAAKKAHPSVITIWMQRKHANKTQEDFLNQELLDFQPDEVVTDVREIVDVVKS